MHQAIAYAPFSLDEIDRARRLLGRIAARLQRCVGGLTSREDLLAHGWVGLLEARRRMPGLRGEEFENYASLRVRGAMIDHLRARAPGSRGERRVGAARALDRQAAPEELERLEAPEQAPDEQVSRRETLGRLEAALAALPQRLRQVVELSYQEDRSLKEIGAQLGVTESRASQLRTEALRQLREMHCPGKEHRTAPVSL